MAGDELRCHMRMIYEGLVLLVLLARFLRPFGQAVRLVLQGQMYEGPPRLFDSSASARCRATERIY
jgi:hypothetical protein